MDATKPLLRAVEPPTSQAMSTDGQAPWRVSYWACGADPLICCSSAFFPCFVYANNTSDLEGNHANYWRNCCLLLCLPTGVDLLTRASVAGLMAAAMVPPQAATVSVTLATGLAVRATIAAIASPRRRHLREQEGLAAAPCSDFWAWFWCPALALCQEAAHVQARKEAQLQALRGSQLAAVVPPHQQSMMA